MWSRRPSGSPSALRLWHVPEGAGHRQRGGDRPDGVSALGSEFPAEPRHVPNTGSDYGSRHRTLSRFAGPSDRRCRCRMVGLAQYASPVIPTCTKPVSNLVNLGILPAVLPMDPARPKSPSRGDAFCAVAVTPLIDVVLGMTSMTPAPSSLSYPLNHRLVSVEWSSR